MSPSIITAAVLDTVLGHLAPLFLAGTAGDCPAARQAAAHQAADSTLAAYHCRTEEELRLAAAIISFGFHALDALRQATAPDLPLTRVLRLRGNAVSLNREAYKNQRKLDLLQRARSTPAAQPVQATPIPNAIAPIATAPNPATPNTPAPIAPTPNATTPTPPTPDIDQALGLIDFAREALQASSRNQPTSWTLTRQQRRNAQRIAETFKRKQAEHVRRQASSSTLPAGAPSTRPAAAAIGMPDRQPASAR